jgi:hypothetical protein
MFRSLPAPSCHTVRPPGDGILCAGACLAPSQHVAGVSSQWRCRETPAGQHISPGRRRGAAGDRHIASMATAATQQAELQAPPTRLTQQDLVDYLASGCHPSPSQWRYWLCTACTTNFARVYLAVRMCSREICLCSELPDYRLRIATSCAVLSMHKQACSCTSLHACRAQGNDPRGACLQYSQRALHPTVQCSSSYGTYACRIGTEHEKLAMKAGTMERAGYAEIQQLLNGLVTRYGWHPMMEGGALPREQDCCAGCAMRCRLLLHGALSVRMGVEWPECK